MFLHKNNTKSYFTLEKHTCPRFKGAPIIPNLNFSHGLAPDTSPRDNLPQFEAFLTNPTFLVQSKVFGKNILVFSRWTSKTRLTCFGLVVVF